MAENAEFDLEGKGLRLVGRVLWKACNRYYGGAWPWWVDTEELEREALLALTRKLREGSLDSALAWKVAHDAVIDTLRKEHRKDTPELDAPVRNGKTRDGESDDGGQSLLDVINGWRDIQEQARARHREGLISRLYEAIKDLPQRQQRAVMLHYWEGHTAPEIARIMRTTSKAAKRLIQHARDSLREILDGAGPSTGSQTVIDVEGKRRRRAA